MNNQLFDNLEIRQFRAFDFLKIEQLGHINLFLGNFAQAQSKRHIAINIHMRI